MAMAVAVRRNGLIVALGLLSPITAACSGRRPMLSDVVRSAQAPRSRRARMAGKLWVWQPVASGVISGSSLSGLSGLSDWLLMSAPA